MDTVTRAILDRAKPYQQESSEEKATSVYLKCKTPVGQPIIILRLVEREGEMWGTGNFPSGGSGYRVHWR